MKMASISAQLAAIERTVKQAMVAETALEWLWSYGPKEPQPNTESISASVHQNLASACPGAKEARQYLERAILAKFGDICAIAVKMAEDDLAAGCIALPLEDRK